MYVEQLEINMYILYARYFLYEIILHNYNIVFIQISREKEREVSKLRRC